MIEEITTNIVTTTINSFDFPFCAIVNLATYLAIKGISDIKIKNKRKHKLTTWNKRIILIIISIIAGIIYYINGSDIKTIFNSIILAPVSWSWIFKPICDRLNIGYSSKTK